MHRITVIHKQKNRLTARPVKIKPEAKAKFDNRENQLVIKTAHKNTLKAPRKSTQKKSLCRKTETLR